MRHLATILMLTLVVFAANTSAVAEEEPAMEQRLGTFKVELDNGSYYWCHVPDDYVSDGSYGIILILHGAGGSADGMLAGYIGRTNFLQEHKYIGVAPKSLGASWTDNETTPMDALNDAMKKYKHDKERIHILGYSAGGFFSGWLAYEKPKLFRTVVIIAAFLARANMGEVKRHKDKPIYLIAGENDPNLAGAKSDYQTLLQMGARYARLLEVPGMGHNNFPFHNHFPLVFQWYKAMESGYDYAEKLEKAEKYAKRNYRKAIDLVHEIEKQPEEKVFWERLAKVKEMIDEKGQKKLKSLMLTLKRKPPEYCIEKLERFLETFKGFPCGDKAEEELKKQRELLKEKKKDEPGG